MTEIQQPDHSISRPAVGYQPPKQRQRPIPVRTVHKGPQYTLTSIGIVLYTFSVVAISKNPTFVNLSQYIGFGLAFLFIIEFLSVRGNKLELPRPLGSLIGFTLLLAFSSLWARSPSLTLTRVITLIQLLVLMVIFINVVKSTGSLNAIGWGMIAGLMYASVEAFRGTSPSSTSFDYQIPGRAASVLGNPNTYAIALCVGLMICVYFIEEHQNKLFRVLLIGVALLFAYQVMFLAGSRKGILTLFLAPGVYILLRHYSIRRKISAGVVIRSSLLIGLVVWGLSLVLQQSEFAYRLSNIGTDISTTNRIAFIQWGFRNFWSRPIFGYGGDQFRVYWPGGNIYSHTNYIELLFNNGLVGILIYYSFFITLIRGFFAAFREQRLSARDFRWSMTVIAILLFWDTAMVSYYDKFIWIAYSLLAAVYTMTVDVKPEPIAQEKVSYVGRPARYGISQDR